MQMSKDVKYRFALDERGTAVDVLSIQSPEDIEQRTFHCVACGERMIARLGTEVSHHFAHKPNSLCSGETYLHKLAKKVFQEEFETCLATGRPFEIELDRRTICSRYPNRSVCQFRKPFAHDLTKHFPAKPQIETAQSGVVPDMTLESKSGNEQLFIEIAVTHECSEEKKNLKKRIIEIRVTSEGDLQPFRDHRLSCTDKRIRFFNFKEQKDVRKDICSWFNCRLEKHTFKLQENGGWSIEQIDRNAPEAGQNGPDVWCIPVLVERKKRKFSADFEEYDRRPIIASAAYDAWQRNRITRACLLCEHLDYWISGECQKFGTRAEWSRAIRCEHFSLQDSEELNNIFSHELSDA